ncbi:unnamed protein product, partial [Symbiodinium microadriaticum]
AEHGAAIIGTCGSASCWTGRHCALPELRDKAGQVRCLTEKIQEERLQVQQVIAEQRNYIDHLHGVIFFLRQELQWWRGQGWTGLHGLRAF